MKFKKEAFSIYSPSKSTHSESNHPILEKNKLDQSLETEKTIFIQLNNRKIPIKIDKTEEESLTIGWLLSEAIRKITTCFENEKEFKNIKVVDPKKIVLLQTKEKILGIDYLLTCFEEKLAYLKDGMTLVPKLTEEVGSFSQNKVGISSFRFISIIGEGNFSIVTLAQKHDNGRFYCIKIIDKKEMISRDKEELVFNERNILVSLNHPFLIKLHYAFQTRKKLFFAMDFCIGGDLFFHSKKKKRFSEDEAKIYVIEILLALDYLHSNHIIYRDLKLENILVAMDGHLKLADFGLAKICSNKDGQKFQKFDTFCGTSIYMAPEMIKQQPYDKTLDYYSLGIILYELLFGVPPFYSANFNFDDLKTMILHKEITFPKGAVSKNAMDLIMQLTAKDLRKRIGFNQGFKEIIAHSWLANLDVEAIKRKSVPAPVIPNIHEINFDQELVKKDLKCLDDACSEEPNTNSIGLYDRFSNFSFSIENREQRFSIKSIHHPEKLGESFELMSMAGQTQSEKLPYSKNSKIKLKIFNEEFRKELEFLRKKSTKTTQKQIFEDKNEDLRAERTPKIQKLPDSKEKHVWDVVKKEEYPFIDDISSIRSSNLLEGPHNQIFLKKDEIADMNEVDDLKAISKELFHEKPKCEQDSSYHTALDECEGEKNLVKHRKYLRKN